MTVAEKKKSKPVRKFRLRRDAGPHFEKNPDFDRKLAVGEDNIEHFEVKPGQVVSSSDDLMGKFPNKFIPIVNGRPQADDSVPENELAENDEIEDEDQQDETSGLEKKKAKKRKGTDVGKDVTDKFEGAEDADFLVYRKGDVYSISEADDPHNPIKTDLNAKQVKKELKKLIGDDE